MKRLFIFIIFSFAVFNSCEDFFGSAEYGSLGGIVYDAETNAPIEGVRVTLEPSGQSTVTDSEGEYLFEGLQFGKYTLDLKKNGYQSHTKVVDIDHSKRKNINLSINRIPAMVVTDREKLEFGSDASVTQLSFGIVNSSYENLEWSVTWDKENVGWITGVVDNSGKSEGVLGHGKTASLVLTIDRRLLSEGLHSAKVFILSDNGRCELTVTVIGSGDYMGSTLMLSVTDIDEFSAVLKAKVIEVGEPEYDEIGFVISESSITPEAIGKNCKKIVVDKSKSSEFSAKVTNLSKGGKYYVRSYIKNDVGISYSSNEMEFSTLNKYASVKTLPVTDINIVANTVTFNGCVGEVGVPVYTEKGFVYNVKGNPTLDDVVVKVAGTEVGDYSTMFTKLQKYATNHYVRAYVVQNDVVLYGDVVMFKMQSVEAEVSTLTASEITTTSVCLNGSIDESGIPQFSEVGFCYSVSDKYPTISNDKVIVDGVTSGRYSHTLKLLQYTTSPIYYRAYIIQGDDVIYGEIKSFNLKLVTPNVSTLDPSEVRATSAVLNGYITTLGEPEISEMGFFYTSNPFVSTNDKKVIVRELTQGQFSYKLENLATNSSITYMAYAIQNGELILGDDVNFRLKSETASVRTLTPKNITQNSVGLYGYVSSLGDPAITERGFCVSESTHNVFAEYVLPVSGTSVGEFSYTLRGLSEETTYYVWAYVVQGGTKVFGEMLTFDTLGPQYTEIYTSEVTDVSYTSVTLNGNLTDLGNPQATEIGFCYGTSYYPDITDNILPNYSVKMGKYSMILDGLSHGTQYFVRAYAKQGNEVVYGNSVSFTTLKDPGFESLNVGTPKFQQGSTYYYTVSCSYVLVDGNPEVLECGLVYDVEDNPVLETRASNSPVTKALNQRFECEFLLEDLEPRTTYYVRPYALTENGYYYGTVKSFTTGITL